MAIRIELIRLADGVRGVDRIRGTRSKIIQEKREEERRSSFAIERVGLTFGHSS